jgi:hypothetical protein
MLPRLLLAGFLLAHAAIHAGYLQRPPATAGGPAWPFELGRSWLLTPLGIGPTSMRLLGLALVVVLVAAYALAAVAAAGLLPSGLFAPAVVAGSVASLALLGLFFHPWLVLGIAIDLALLWVVMAGRADSAIM